MHLDARNAQNGKEGFHALNMLPYSMHIITAPAATIQLPDPGIPPPTWNCVPCSWDAGRNTEEPPPPPPPPPPSGGRRRDPGPEPAEPAEVVDEKLATASSAAAIASSAVGRSPLLPPPPPSGGTNAASCLIWAWGGGQDRRDARQFHLQERYP